uniref:Uncharacterized protein n=1 Tax=Schistocephalus solidus TaxID=70667 RepID=A0A0V0J2K8_SCHSO
MLEFWSLVKILGQDKRTRTNHPNATYSGTWRSISEILILTLWVDVRPVLWLRLSLGPELSRGVELGHGTIHASSNITQGQLYFWGSYPHVHPTTQHTMVCF